MNNDYKEILEKQREQLFRIKTKLLDKLNILYDNDVNKNLIN